LLVLIIFSAQFLSWAFVRNKSTEDFMNLEKYTQKS
jgi:hypothetical protein